MTKILVSFDTTSFVRSYGKEPKGRGSWAFSVEEAGQTVYFSPSMTYVDARKWMTAEVRKMDVPADFGVVTISVLS